MADNNPVSSAVGGLLTLAVSAGIVVWIVIPGWIGAGTQRSPAQGDVGKPADWSQWFFANVTRMGGDLGVTFFPDRINGAVAGTAGQGKGKQYLPQDRRQTVPPGDIQIPPSAAIQTGGVASPQSSEAVSAPTTTQSTFRPGTFLTYEQLQQLEQSEGGQ